MYCQELTSFASSTEGEGANKFKRHFGKGSAKWKVRINFPQCVVNQGVVWARNVWCVSGLVADGWRWWCGPRLELSIRLAYKFKHKCNLNGIERLESGREKVGMCVCRLLVSLVYTAHLPSSIRQVGSTIGIGQCWKVKRKRWSLHKWLESSISTVKSPYQLENPITINSASRPV